MSSGRTMPATVTSRISKLTRTSCRPWITRLPLGSVCVMTAARFIRISSARLTPPLPMLRLWLFI
jgi:hypothetical protein